MKNVQESNSRSVKMAAALAAVLLAAAPVRGQQVVAKLDGTSRSTFKVGATSAAPLSLQNVSGRLTLGNGLRVSGGTVDFSGATIANFSLTSGSLTGVTIDNSVIGGSTPAAGTFTSLTSASGALNGTIGGTTPAAGTFTAITGPHNGTVGATTPASGAFTTLSSSGQYTNTVSTGTAPLVVSSTTLVTNLNADRTDGIDLGSISGVGKIILSGSGSLTEFPSTASDNSKLLMSTGTGSAPFWFGSSSNTSFIIGGGGNGWSQGSFSGDFTVNSSCVATIGTGAITSGKILDGTIAAGDLASNSVTTAKIADANVTLAKMAASSVDSAAIVNGTILLEDMASNSVGSSNIVDGGVSANDLGTDAVTTVKILDSNVTTAKIAASNVTAAKLADAVADAVPTATASVGSEAADTIRVSLQVKDAQGNALAGYHFVPWSITDGASGALPNSSVLLTTNTATGTDWHVVTAEYRKFAVTNSAGLLELDVICGTDSTVNAHFWVGALHYTVALDFN